jgi:DNA-nicking Smr family endonuclease
MSSDDAIDDKDAFAAAMRGVRPLRHKPRVAKSARAKAIAKRARERAAADRPAAVTADGTFRHAGVTRPTWRRFRRGEIPVTAELDLHGRTGTEAGAALDEFLAECRARGVACARIIHGKGRRSGPGGPVLKGIVHDELLRAADVLAFVPAASSQGGSGAVVVLFRG